MKSDRTGGRTRRFVRPMSGVLLLFATSYTVWAVATDLALVGALHEPQAQHVDQQELTTLVVNGQVREAFLLAFARGNQLFDTAFNALDGVGANVGQNQRFTRVPRADLDGPQEWKNHSPRRTTGPNAEACNDCHNAPVDAGAGAAALDVHRDPRHTTDLALFIRRNTPHLFGMGAVQRLAEEMTTELQNLRDEATDRACQTGATIVQRMETKDVDFGSISVTCDDVDTAALEGIGPDLVVRPFQWKGIAPFIRGFNRNASHNELGMQAVELVGPGVDGDFDGVVDEMSVGDQTALAIYMAGQPRPTTKAELSDLGLIAPLSTQERQAIRRGESVFRRAKCAACHVPELTIDDPVFSEPSSHPNFRDSLFVNDTVDPITFGVDPATAISFDLTQDQPDNIVLDGLGHVVARFGTLETDMRGRAIVALYGDLKRHDMGPELAEPIDEIGTGPSVFLTENLWGVGSTPPYLHDGRATTLTEAIVAHGGAAADSRDAFLRLSTQAQSDVIAFLNNLVLYKIDESAEAIHHRHQASAASLLHSPFALLFLLLSLTAIHYSRRIHARDTPERR